MTETTSVLRERTGRLSLRWKINLIGIFVIAMFSLILFSMILPRLEKEKYEERRGKLKAVVNSYVSLIDYYERSLRVGSERWKTDPSMPRTIEEAKRHVLKELQQVRYDKTEFLFIIDGDGRMVMDPLKPELDGTNVLGVRDPKGKEIFKEMFIAAQRDGDAFVSFTWQAKYSPEIFEPQVAYGKHYWPWDWVVCSGVYTQDIVESVRALRNATIISDVIASSIAMAFLFVVGGAVSKNEERHKKQLTEARDNLWGEMQLAKKIQTVLLPRNPKLKGYQIAVHCNPAAEVGGDYYDVINVGDRDWLVIGDVSGHGVPAGLLMMMVQTSLHVAISQNPNISPLDALSVINSTITANVKHLGDDRYMTITVLATYKDGQFLFSGLHQDLMVHRAKKREIESIETRGIWLGIIDPIGRGMLEEDSLELDVGDTLLLFTDGLTEAMGTDGQMFSAERLRKVFAEVGDESPQVIKDHILDALKGFRCDDDVTFVVLKRVPEES